MLYFIYFFTILLSYLSKNRIIRLILIFLLILILFSLNTHHIFYYLSYNYGNQDFINYYSMYNATKYDLLVRNVEYGFIFFILFANKFGLSFIGFKVIIALISYALIFFGIKNLTNHIYYVLLLYLVFPFINDIIQIRNLLSYSIVFFAISYFLFGERKRYFIYIIFVFLASSIHQTSYVFLLLPFFYIFKSWVVKLITYFIIPFSLIFMYTGVLHKLVNYFSLNYKILKYTEELRTWGGIIILLYLLMIYLSNVYMTKSTKKIIDLSPKQKRLNNNIIILNYFGLLTGVLWFYNLNFIRIYRNIFLFNYILFFEIYFAKRYEFSGNVLKVIMSIGYVFILFIIFYLIHYESQIRPIFEDNIIIDFLK